VSIEKGCFFQPAGTTTVPRLEAAADRCREPVRTLVGTGREPRSGNFIDREISKSEHQAI